MFPIRFIRGSSIIPLKIIIHFADLVFYTLRFFFLQIWSVVCLVSAGRSWYGLHTAPFFVLELFNIEPDRKGGVSVLLILFVIRLRYLALMRQLSLTQFVPRFR